MISTRKGWLCSLLFGLCLQIKLYANIFITGFPVLGFSSNIFDNLAFSRQAYLLYMDEPRIMQAGIDFSLKGFKLYTRFELFRNPYLWQKGYGFCNMPLPDKNVPWTGAFNANFPTEGWLSYDNDYFDISLGRRKLSMGPGQYGLTLDQHAPASDGYWIGLHPMPNYKVRLYGIFVGIFSNMEANRRFLTKNQRYWAGAAVEDSIWSDTPIDGQPAKERYTNSFKGFFVHKLGVEGDTWRVGLTGSVMIYGGTPSFEQFSPLTIWHNNYNQNANSLLDLSFEVKLPQETRLYGTIAMDDLRLGESDTDKPTAMAFMLGTDWHVLQTDEPYNGQIYKDAARTKNEQSFCAQDGLILGLETIYSSRYMYGRKHKDPFGKIAFFAVPQYGVNKWPLVEYFLGFPFGPETYLCELTAKYSHSKCYIESSLGYLLEGRKGLGVYYMEDPNNCYDKDAIPDDAAGKRNSFAFDGPLKHYMVLQFMLYYYLRDWVQLYTATYQKVCFNQFSSSLSTVSLGVVFHWATSWLTSPANKKA